MIFPNNGKVIIFDDVPQDVTELFKALSQERVPFFYFQDEGGNDLPLYPIKNVRLVFLDLQLGANISDGKKIISAIRYRFKQTLEKGAIYVLVLWTRKASTYRKEIDEAFNSGGALEDYRPLKIIEMPKHRIIEVADVVSNIRAEFQTEFNQFNSFNALLHWESIVNDSSGELTNSVVSTLNLSNSNFNDSVNTLLFKLASAMLGDESKSASDKEKLDAALQLLNITLIDNVEKNIFKLPFNSELNISEKELTNNGIIETLNSKLHLIEDEGLSNKCTGNVFICDKHKGKIQLIAKGCYPNKVEQILQTDAALCYLDITPRCDYAQKKHYVRFIEGICIDSPGVKHNTNGYQYSVKPELTINGKKKRLIFDYRFIHSFTFDHVDVIIAKAPNFRLRDSLINDIQAGVSSHTGRLGIVSID